MTDHPFRLHRAAFVAATIALSLAACGGDNSNGDVDPTSGVPDSASQSVEGFIEYLKRLVATAPETLEPVDTSAVTAPTSETAEPTAVD